MRAVAGTEAWLSFTPGLEAESFKCVPHPKQVTRGLGGRRGGTQNLQVRAEVKVKRDLEQPDH